MEGFAVGAWIGEGTAGNPKSLANSMNSALENAKGFVGRDPAGYNRELDNALFFAQQLLQCPALKRTEDGVTPFEVVTAENLVSRAQ